MLCEEDAVSVEDGCSDAQTYLSNQTLAQKGERQISRDARNPVRMGLANEDGYWLDLCLTPRPANTRARYRDRWGPHRFERVGPC